jgi:hypothetical protein
MERLDFIVFALWGFILVLAALNIVYVVYSKITLIYMKTSDMIRFALKMLWYRILYFFSPKKTTPSHSTTQPSTETLTLSDLYNPAPLAPQQSPSKSCSPQKSISKKRDTKGRFVRN